MMIIFSFCKFFVVMDGISANDLFQASAFSKGYNGKCAKGFLQLCFAFNMCQCFVRISVVMLDYMFLIKGCIVYHDVFVDWAVVSDRVCQPSELAV